MIFRPTTASDLDRFLPLIVTDAAGGMAADTYTARLSAGEYRPDWTWIAEDAAGGTPLALAVWWGDPDEDLPGALDGVFVRDSRPGPAPNAPPWQPGCSPPRTRPTPGPVRAQRRSTTSPSPVTGATGPTRSRPCRWRQEAARRAGLTVLVERLRYEWTPGTGLPRAHRPSALRRRARRRGLRRPVPPGPDGHPRRGLPEGGARASAPRPRPARTSRSTATPCPGSGPGGGSPGPPRAARRLRPPLPQPRLPRGRVPGRAAGAPGPWIRGRDPGRGSGGSWCPKPIRRRSAPTPTWRTRRWPRPSNAWGTATTPAAWCCPAH